MDIIKYAKNGDFENIKRLVEAFGKNLGKNDGADINHQNNYGNTALIYCSEKGHFDIVKFLVEKGANINHQDKNGYTSLICASNYGCLDIVKFLLEKSDNINHQTNTGSTALMYASRCGYLNIVKFLVEKDANIKLEVNKQHPVVVKELTTFNINLEIDFKLTAITWAAFFNHLDIINYLIEKGADINHLPINYQLKYNLVQFNGNKKTNFNCAIAFRPPKAGEKYYQFKDKIVIDKFLSFVEEKYQNNFIGYFQQI